MIGNDIVWSNTADDNRLEVVDSGGWHVEETIGDLNNNEVFYFVLDTGLGLVAGQLATAISKPCDLSNVCTINKFASAVGVAQQPADKGAQQLDEDSDDVCIRPPGDTGSKPETYDGNEDDVYAAHYPESPDKPETDERETDEQKMDKQEADKLETDKLPKEMVIEDIVLVDNIEAQYLNVDRLVRKRQCDDDENKHDTEKHMMEKKPKRGHVVCG